MSYEDDLREWVDETKDYYKKRIEILEEEIQQQSRRLELADKVIAEAYQYLPEGDLYKEYQQCIKEQEGECTS
jgi:hypothetical protein